MAIGYGESGYGTAGYGGGIMADIDKFMGWRDDSRVYGAYRIDFASTEDIRKVELEDGSVEYRFGSSAIGKSPPPDHPDHQVKPGYQRKIVVADDTARDRVQNFLDAEGIDYVTEDIAPTASERTAMEEWGVEEAKDVAEALTWSEAIGTATTVEELKDVQRGRHPTTGDRFERPRKQERRRKRR